MYASCIIIQVSLSLLGTTPNSDCQNAEFALFKSIKSTNIDINDAACLHVVHILQHPTSRPSMKSTQNTMVNVPKKNLLPPLAGKDGKSTKRST